MIIFDFITTRTRIPRKDLDEKKIKPKRYSLKPLGDIKETRAKMNNYLQLLEEISTQVISLFIEPRVNILMYHNVEHTKTVVKRTSEIAANYHLSETELFILSAAAWFHDTGQLMGDADLHEHRGVILMKKFLQTKGLAKEVMNKIEGCIYATRLPQNPKSLLEEIVCDADTYNLGTEAFITTDELLKKEFELRNMPIDNWEEKTLKFLLSHNYFTTYCHALLNKGREKNIDLVRYRVKEKTGDIIIHTG
ncbi:HD domain-containing protein [Ginsengibacter hankyongi]|uniref:HD domain-containing protein n=1 Tax=Ginsengibacter hankyongi TaxID=2607284 RepID=A0A5J5IL50_9BACT|nr:HD domain-containing protein [Ginsengibacter hankyongi]KAA9040797.1 HD domain-containing protein [Ginsengibacter hankyongi]